MIQIIAKQTFTTKTGAPYTAKEGFVPWTLSNEETGEVLTANFPLEKYKEIIASRKGMIDEVPYFSADPIEQEEQLLMYESGMPDAIPLKFIKVNQAELHLKYLAEYEANMKKLGFKIEFFPYNPQMDFEMRANKHALAYN